MKCRICNREFQKDWYGYIDKTGKHLICGKCYIAKKEVK